MTPKEKAIELVDKFKNGLWKDRGVSIYSEDAIYCALITVDELIKQESKTDDYYEIGSYWEEVKQEIELL